MQTFTNSLLVFTSRVKSLLLDYFIPAYNFGNHEGNAFFVYSFQKSVLKNNKLVCSLMDPIVLKKSENGYTYITIGSLTNDEVLPSFQLPRNVNLIELFFSLFYIRLIDVKDYQFLDILYDSPMLCLLKRGGRWHEWRWFRRSLAIRNFLLAHYFSLKFRKIALECDKAYVLVYYNAIMLGVVRAFRKLKKEAWDVQHGYLGPDHGAYSNVHAFEIASTFQPSGFLVWDSRFGAHIESVLKMPWQATDNHHISMGKVSNKGNGCRFSILYSLQWGTQVPHWVQTSVRKFINVHWNFRMHPFDDLSPTDLNWIKDMQNCTITGSNESLIDALQRCNLHITLNSGVVHEAAALGIESIFLDKYFTVRVGYELSLGMAEYASSQTLVSAIASRIELFDAGVSECIR
uniref:hypothetical protein n=1 Tax=Polynucleobacter sp. TaxID=2029855 RepID=UPI004047A15C